MSRRLGQHWLVNPVTAQRVVDALGPQAGERVLEIGGGRGALTRLLIERQSDLTVVELDAWCVEQLQALVGDRGQVVAADVLTLRLAGLTSGPWAVIGNLPYESTSPILLWLCQQAEQVKRAVVMVQREVAARLTAAPGEPERGRLTVAVEYRFRASRIFDVPPDHFAPPPRVVSTVLGLSALEQPAVAMNDEGWFFKVVEMGFRHRRKTLATGLSSSLGDRSRVSAGLLAAGIALDRRPGTLSLAEWAAVSEALAP